MDKIETIKYVRGKTGLGIFDVKKALEHSDWDVEKAIQYIRSTAQACTKPVGAGSIFSYVHHNNKIGVLLEVKCATDFVAVNSDFLDLGHTLAMHIAAFNPKNVEELLNQDHISQGMKVSELIKLVSATFNEPIVIERFVCYELGVNKLD